MSDPVMAGRYCLCVLKIDGLETMGRSHARNSLALLFATAFAAPAFAQPAPLVGAAAFGDWRADKPGVSRLIRPDELPKPGATPSAANVSHVVPRPPSALPQVPAGFKIGLFAEGLNGPRQLRVAPNGDIFIAETRAGRLRVLRAAEGSAEPSADEIFASGLHPPFGKPLLPRRRQPAMGLRRRHRPRRSLPLQARRSQGRGQAGDRRRRTAARLWTLDQGHRLHRRR